MMVGQLCKLEGDVTVVAHAEHQIGVGEGSHEGVENQDTCQERRECSA